MIWGRRRCASSDDDAAHRTTTLRIVSRLDVTHLPSGAALPRAALDPIAAHIPFSYAAAESLIRVGVSRTPEQTVSVGGGYVGDPTDPVSLDVEVAAELVADPS